MYVQPIFEETRSERLRHFMLQYPLATLVVPCQDGPEANLMPLQVVSPGVLRGHVARLNPLWHTAVPGAMASAVFQGPNAYISPRWYVNGAKSGRVAPSWNYATVHAHGPVRFIDDADWLKHHLQGLTHQQEAGRDHPWQLADAPAEFADMMVSNLIGFEMTVERLVGKWFLSQQRTPADRRSIVGHLGTEGSGMALDLAGLIRAKEAESDPAGAAG